MAVKVTHYCDRCEREEHPQDLVEVNVTVRSKETKELEHFPREKMFICPDCLDELGFDRKRNRIPNPLPATFEFIKNLFCIGRK